MDDTPENTTTHNVARAPTTLVNTAVVTETSELIGNIAIGTRVCLLLAIVFALPDLMITQRQCINGMC
jgi:hypothetical protein